jgi:magnesium transporter
VIWYLSDLIGKPIYNEAGERIAQLRDLVIRVGSGDGYPPVSGLVTRSYWKSFYIPWDRVEHLDRDGFHLRSALVSLHTFQRREGEMLLAKDVLDKQVVDVRGRRVVRANDLRLTYQNGRLFLIGIDVSPRALLHRLLPRRIELETKPGTLIDWRDIEPLASESPGVRLKITHERLSKLNPVDIAHIVEELAAQQGTELVASLDDATAADTLEEMNEELQADIVEGMDEERVADILEEMNPDDAADLLATLSEEKRRDLLQRMDRAEAAEIEGLLQYPSDRVGGLMTTDLVAVTPDMTAAEVIERIRTLEHVPDVIAYIYVVDDLQERRLVGVTSLRDVLRARPDQPVREFMMTDYQTATPDEEAKEAASIMSEYNLLALPVVDRKNRLLGIVTVDDAMELLLPDQFRKQVPRVFS